MDNILKCKHCGKEINHIEAHIFNHNHSDSSINLPITKDKESGTYLIETSANITALEFDYDEEDFIDHLACPLCGKPPMQRIIDIQTINCILFED